MKDQVGTNPLAEEETNSFEQRIITTVGQPNLGVTEDEKGFQSIVRLVNGIPVTIAGPFLPELGVVNAKLCIKGKTPLIGLGPAMNSMAATIYVLLDQLDQAQTRISELESQNEI